MKIFFYKKTNLAKNPDTWAYYLKKYRNIDTVVGNRLIECDFIHFNNTYETFADLQKRSLMHYHGHPDHENKRGTLHHGYPGYTIINAAHIANGASKDYEPLRWIPIDLNSEFYDVTNPTDKIRICYSPSVTVSSHNFPYHSKGYEQTIPILQNIKNMFGDKVEIVVISNTSYEMCLKLKAQSNIVIDECITGNYHMSGFEGLGMGKLVIGHISDANRKLMLDRLCPQAERFPYESVYITELQEFLIDLIKNNRLDFVIERGKQNKEWINLNWNLEEMLDEMLARYERIMNS